MKYTEELLDALKDKTGKPSDYALARDVFHIAPSSLIHIRERGLSDERALEIAELLGLDAGEVLARVHAERAKTERAREAWEKLAATLRAGVAASVVFTIAAVGALHLAAASNHALYIMSTRRNRANPLILA